MDNYFILKKEKLGGFLKAAMKDFCLVAPQKTASGDFLFQEVRDPGKISLDYDITSNTLKEFFFPRRETLFSFEKKAGGAVKVTPAQDKDKRPVIFFGLRSCDVRAVHFQDLFFGRDPKDPFYWRKRNKALLISVACNKPPRESCFCVHTQSGPFLKKGAGFDLQLIDLSGDFLVEVGSQKGRDLVKKYARFFAPAGKAALQKGVSLKEQSLKAFSSAYDLMDIRKKLNTADLRELWKQLGKRCTNCGGCAFVCPSCFCFYQQDIKTSKNKGERIRAWDCCVFIGHGRMAGDTSPHETNAERVNRRFFCKLHNSQKWFEVSGCTGCGRCSFVCPVNMDMESFLKSLALGETYKPLLKEL